MCEEMKRINDTKVEDGTLALWWMGQMGLIIKSGTTTIAIDYFATPTPERQVPPPIPAKELVGIDAFLGTHDHLDHIDHEAWKIWAKADPNAKFIFSRAHEKSVAEDGIEEARMIGLNAGESVSVGDITVHAIPASHEFLDKDEKTGIYPHLQYIIESNGIKIHHAGDTVRYEGMLAAVKELGPIDVELLPINGRDAFRYSRNCIGNMTYQEAADFAGDVGTRIVIPGHFDMFADNSEDPVLFKDYIEAKYGKRLICIIPSVMEKITIEAK
jgi:L-ascorbate metabolism protein UlaG (beta-lactamase superfamily)